MSDPIESALADAHRIAMDELHRCAGEYGPDAPETIAAHARSRVTGRAVRNHYTGIAERKFGRI